MEIVQNISLSLNTEPPFYSLKMRQGDGARSIQAKIFENAKAWEILEGTGIEFRAKKPDGTKIVRNDGITYTENVVTIPITANTIAAVGIVNCEIVFFDSQANELGTVNFNIDVWAAAVPFSEIKSEDDFQSLQQAVEQAEAYKDEAGQYAADASSSEAAAQQAVQQAQNARDQYPTINGETNTWKLYNVETGQYVDTDYPSRGPQGETGPQGPEGTTLKIMGIYATLPALQQAHPTGTVGDAYAVGTEQSNVIYCWDVDQNAWRSIGALQGPIGPQGETGPQGPAGKDGAKGADGAAATIAVGTVNTGEAGTNVVITNSGTSSAAVFNFTIPRGQDGAQGPQGPQGTPTTVNGKSGTNITLTAADVGAMSTGTAQTMTASLKAMTNPAETTAQMRNIYIAPNGTEPTTINVPVGTLIFIKEA